MSPPAHKGRKRADFHVSFIEKCVKVKHCSLTRTKLAFMRAAIILHSFLKIMAARPRRYSAMAAMEQILAFSYEGSDGEENVSDIEEDELEIQGSQNDGEDESDTTANEEEEEIAPLNLAQRLNLGTLTSPDGEIWQKEQPRGGRRPARNIIRNQPGPTPFAAARLHDELSAFLLIFDNEMIETLVVETNREGYFKDGEAFQPTSVVEMRAYVHGPVHSQGRL